MQFPERTESFAGHDQSDITDIMERRHDISSPIIAIRIDPGFPRD